MNRPSQIIVSVFLSSNFALADTTKDTDRRLIAGKIQEIARKADPSAVKNYKPHWDLIDSLTKPSNSSPRSGGLSQSIVYPKMPIEEAVNKFRTARDAQEKAKAAISLSVWQSEILLATIGTTFGIAEDKKHDEELKAIGKKHAQILAEGQEFVTKSIAPRLEDYVKKLSPTQVAMVIRDNPFPIYPSVMQYPVMKASPCDLAEVKRIRDMLGPQIFGFMKFRFVFNSAYEDFAFGQMYVKRLLEVLEKEKSKNYELVRGYLLSALANLNLAVKKQMAESIVKFEQKSLDGLSGQVSRSDLRVFLLAMALASPSCLGHLDKNYHEIVRKL